MSDNTYKVYLTAEQWAKVCAGDKEIITGELAKQQPELFSQLETEHAEHPAKKSHRTTVIEK